ncbi:hypothetical protein KIPB_015280, partial [Kipferlia bialata]
PAFLDVQHVLLTGIIRMADISNAGRPFPVAKTHSLNVMREPFPVAKTHSLNVMREFFRTGDIEEACGLQVGDYRDSDQGAY